MILNDFTNALSQMTDPRFRNVLLKGVGLTFGLLFVVFAVVSMFRRPLWYLGRKALGRAGEET